MKWYYSSVFLLITFILFANLSQAQNNKKDLRISPKAGVMQTVGFTEVRIDYSRPGVKKREIWGKLVPYDAVWRAGANEATKITFSTDVTIEGKKLKKGSYSLFAIPGKNDWTIIFNKVADQWGAFEYNESEDALRVKVKTEKAIWQEWLSYTINKASDTSAVIRLEWEKIKVPFKVEVKL
ncbi:MAG: DUF2911 domain-containing protein [Ignavibacterium sp.]|jgi:hypothetical protein|nr:DUF2911 domain-containing protein [Ignavibacterium sp.]